MYIYLWGQFIHFESILYLFINSHIFVFKMHGSSRFWYQLISQCLIRKCVFFFFAADKRLRTADSWLISLLWVKIFGTLRISDLNKFWALLDIYSREWKLTFIQKPIHKCLQQLCHSSKLETAQMSSTDDGSTIYDTYI